MSDPKATTLAENALNDPARAAEADRHYRVIVEAMNGSHTNGEQDALMLYEAIARVIAQVTDHLDDRSAGGIKNFIYHRADDHRGRFKAAGTEAKSFFEPQGSA